MSNNEYLQRLNKLKKENPELPIKFIHNKPECYGFRPPESVQSTVVDINIDYYYSKFEAAFVKSYFDECCTRNEWDEWDKIQIMSMLHTCVDCSLDFDSPEASAELKCLIEKIPWEKAIVVTFIEI